MFTHDYIEIFNRGSGAVSLDGLSLQYANAWHRQLRRQLGTAHRAPRRLDRRGPRSLPRAARPATSRRNRSGRPGRLHRRRHAREHVRYVRQGRARQHDDTARLQRRHAVCSADALARSSTSSAGTAPTSSRARGRAADVEHDSGLPRRRRLHRHRRQRRGLHGGGPGSPEPAYAGPRLRSAPDDADRRGSASPRRAGERLDALTVAVTPGANPRAAAIAVTCDLTRSAAPRRRASSTTGRTATRPPATVILRTRATIPRRPRWREVAPCTVADAEARSGRRRDRARVSRAAGRGDPRHPGRGAHLAVRGQIVSTYGIVTAQALRTATGCRTRTPTRATRRPRASSSSPLGAARERRRRGARQRARAGVPAGRRVEREPDHDRARRRRRSTVVSRGNPLPAADGRRHRRAHPAEQVIEDDATRRRRDERRLRPGRATGSTSGRASRGCASS